MNLALFSFQPVVSVDSNKNESELVQLLYYAHKNLIFTFYELQKFCLVGRRRGARAQTQCVYVCAFLKIFLTFESSYMAARSYYYSLWCCLNPNSIYCCVLTLSLDFFPENSRRQQFIICLTPLDALIVSRNFQILVGCRLMCLW